ncbi:hypothetical protein SAMN04487950_2551 [Halogranum rubrum]|uniref:Uncharacterized protein n=2 Tax=Halogranum rubrum TaxID=553466 RepID=A0A1I4F5E1_9EURY|nr:MULTISPECIES: hypothetical protein [Halogranum]EJN61620.1 hypothetical protein HSB1_06610 [Halogranum salarium B-1]SFL11621.1 hypothetical protein SAMN04487950_2551 [Halogranum rubrum]
MGLLSAVTSRLELTRPDEPSRKYTSEESFAYECGRCETTFERPKSRMTRIRCPDCGSCDVYAADDA